MPHSCYQPYPDVEAPAPALPCWWHMTVDQCNHCRCLDSGLLSTRDAGTGTGPQVLSGESHTCQNIVTVSDTSLAMADIKFTYFDLRVKGEAARILLAYGGLP